MQKVDGTKQGKDTLYLLLSHVEKALRLATIVTGKSVHSLLHSLLHDRHSTTRLGQLEHCDAALICNLTVHWTHKLLHILTGQFNPLYRVVLVHEIGEKSSSLFLLFGLFCFNPYKIKILRL